ncbi:MAG: hypothetical protein R2883_04145 [Caldisericia bacterium]
MEEEKIKKYYTLSSGHPINFYYSVVVYAAIIFMFFPEQFYKLNIGWVYAIGTIGMAFFITWLSRVFFRTGIVRVYLSDTFLQITAKVVQLEDVVRIVLVKRSSKFGRELQIYTGSDLRLFGSIALDELQKPDEMIEDIKATIPQATFTEQYAGYHMVDWGLIVSVVALAVLIFWKLF